MHLPKTFRKIRLFRRSAFECTPKNAFTIKHVRLANLPESEPPPRRNPEAIWGCCLVQLLGSTAFYRRCFRAEFFAYLSLWWQVPGKRIVTPRPTKNKRRTARAFAEFLGRQPVGRLGIGLWRLRLRRRTREHCGCVWEGVWQRRSYWTTLRWLSN